MRKRAGAIVLSGGVIATAGLFAWARRAGRGGPLPVSQGEHPFNLGHGLVAWCSVPQIDRLHVRLTFRKHHLVDEHFDLHSDPVSFDLSSRLVRVGGSLEVDMAAGDIWWSADLRLLGLRLIHVEHEIALRFDPTVGAAGREGAIGIPDSADHGFGRSKPCMPVIMRLHVDDGERHIASVGQKVKQIMFADYPPFIFNTIACVGDPGPGTPGAYTDPRSIWFNIFFGYYQVDCDKKRWARPFAYESASGVDSEPRIEDLVRLGKSDWNWFSNWLYGVPADELSPYSAVDVGSIPVTTKSHVPIGSTLWHELKLEGIKVGSCYESDAPQSRRLVRNTVAADVWRMAFGQPTPRPEYPQSFFPTVLDTVLNMAYWEDDNSYHTFMVGGTAAPGSAPGFLDAQVGLTQDMIRNTYPTLGFSP